MKQLKFVGFYGKSFVSAMIRYFTRTRTYSHIAVMIDDDGGLIEAWPHNGGFKQWTDFSSINKHTPGTKYEVWGLEVFDVIYDKCMDFYMTQARYKVPYDYKGVVGFVLKNAVKEEASKLFCSELAITPVARYLGWETIQPHLVSPRDFINIIEAAGGKKLKDGCVPTVY